MITLKDVKFMCGHTVNANFPDYRVANNEEKTRSYTKDNLFCPWCEERKTKPPLIDNPKLDSMPPGFLGYVAPDGEQYVVCNIPEIEEAMKNLLKRGLPSDDERQECIAIVRQSLPDFLEKLARTVRFALVSVPTTKPLIPPSEEDTKEG